MEGWNIERVAHVFGKKSRIACAPPESESSKGSRRSVGATYLVEDGCN